MSLVGEAGLRSGERGRHAPGEQPARRPHPQLALVLARRQPERPGECPVRGVPAASRGGGQVVGRQAGGALVNEVAEDNRAVVRAAARLDLAGIALCGPRNAVDKVLKGVTLHP